MALEIADFWRLAEASRLFTPEQCQELNSAFKGLKGAAQQANASSLAQWLVAQEKLTRYQARVLLGGRPGPFVFGPIVIVDRLESGRFSKHYIANYEGNQKVHLVFLSQLSSEREDYDSLGEWATASARVKSPHVSRTFQLVKHRTQPFVVAEPLAGQTLREVLARLLDRQHACLIGLQVTLGLLALHEQNLVHGAIAPENIWIEPSGTAKLLQFPLVTSPIHQKHREPPLIDYWAPEWTDAEQPASKEADVYALGCVLFELITGRVPFPGGSVAQKIARHRSEFAQRLDTMPAKHPEELAELVAEMLSKDPLLRTPTATHVAHLLAPQATGVSLRESLPPKIGPGGTAVGYGAWKAPDWKAPPPQKQAVKGRAPQQPATSAKPSPPPQQVAVEQQISPASAAPEFPAEAPLATASEAFGFEGEEVPSGYILVEEPAPIPLDKSALPAFKPQPQPISKGRLAALAGGALAVVAGIVVAALLWGGNDPPVSSSTPTPSASIEPPAEEKEVKPAADAATADAAPSGVAAVDDDGQTLWAAPTAGQPIDVNYLPSGAQVLLALRPAELLSKAEGKRVWDALGPAGTWAKSELETTLGMPLTDIATLLIAFVPHETAGPQVAFVMRPSREIATAELLSAWGGPAAAEHAGAKYYRGAQWSFYLPPSEGGRVVAVASDELLKATLELNGPPILRKGIEKLLRNTDAARQVTLLFTPSYLLADGKSLLAGSLSRLRGPLTDFLDESIEAVACSATLDDDLFLEFRAVAPPDKRPAELVELLRTRWEKIPEQFEAYVTAMQTHPHGRLVVSRLPRMLQLARDFTRVGVESQQVVLRTYLPAEAAHNLLLGTELALSESPAGGPSLGNTPAGAQDPGGPSSSGDAPTVETVAKALERKVSLSFPRESLDRCLEVFGKELGVEIVILGKDLQLEGITRNQSLNDLNERDQPAGVILRKILKLANPDGKLVYLIQPHEGHEAIFISTREAARKRQDKLPEELEPKKAE